ncbi:uncharacterized protein LOC129170384 isoform X6 [Dunckerocampus dactyliophorus]|uniref:uncharacterized protein LOC129170384 isoform X6 n=1 Tax=Dunckerocampus dactyliophorus TaxID=161453 RepID=UPI00240685C3|nr:uncharacterized protein LOC129170384 isoform X6 [Dunckerocampus dactyliophorus]
MVLMGEQAERPLTPPTATEQLLQPRGSRSEAENDAQRRRRRPTDLQLCLDNEPEPCEIRKKTTGTRCLLPRILNPSEQLSPAPSPSGKTSPSGQLSKTDVHFHKLFKQVGRHEALQQNRHPGGVGDIHQENQNSTAGAERPGHRNRPGAARFCVLPVPQRHLQVPAVRLRPPGGGEDVRQPRRRLLPGQLPSRDPVVPSSEAAGDDGEQQLRIPDSGLRQNERLCRPPICERRREKRGGVGPGRRSPPSGPTKQGRRRFTRRGGVPGAQSLASRDLALHPAHLLVSSRRHGGVLLLHGFQDGGPRASFDLHAGGEGARAQPTCTGASGRGDLWRTLRQPLQAGEDSKKPAEAA